MSELVKIILCVYHLLTFISLLIHIPLLICFCYFLLFEFFNHSLMLLNLSIFRLSSFLNLWLHFLQIFNELCLLSGSLLLDFFKFAILSALIFIYKICFLHLLKYVESFLEVLLSCLTCFVLLMLKFLLDFIINVLHLLNQLMSLLFQELAFLQENLVNISLYFANLIRVRKNTCINVFRDLLELIY